MEEETERKMENVGELLEFERERERERERTDLSEDSVLWANETEVHEVVFLEQIREELEQIDAQVEDLAFVVGVGVVSIFLWVN